MIGVIYKIKCNITNEIYIGSTTNFIKRKQHHKELKYSSKNIIKRNNYNFYILDKREFTNNLSLLLLENLYIVICKKYCKCVNTKIAHRTKNIDNYIRIEYRKNNKNKIKLKDKKWYENNKEKIINIRRERNNKKVYCKICNKKMNYTSLSRHNKNIHSNQ